jgi:uncharacterized phage-associated protein
MSLVFPAPVGCQMHFAFDFEKTLQAAAELLRHEPHTQMSRIRLLKLLYIADREALKETGRPITGDAVVAMRHGPVLSRLYDIVKGESSDSPAFDGCVTQQGYQLFLAKDPGKGRLNRYEVRKLKEVSERYRERDEWAISEETHGFPEWEKNDPGDSSRPIPLEDILSAVGHSPERIEAIKRDAARIVKMHGLFRDAATPPAAVSQG